MKLKKSKKEKKGKIRKVDIKLKAGTFTTLLRRFRIASAKHDGLEFSGITALRQLLSNEKARMLHILKIKKPSSLYELAKVLGRDFKSVRNDVELLKQFGFIRFISNSKGKRKSLKPVLNVSQLQVNLSL